MLLLERSIQIQHRQEDMSKYENWNEMIGQNSVLKSENSRDREISFPA